MKKILLFAVFFALLVGCAGTPVRNPQFTESMLPRRYYIEGIKPIKVDPGVDPRTSPFGYWVPCVDIILEFYGRPLGKETRVKAVTKVNTQSIATTVAFGPNAAPSRTASLNNVDSYYGTALGLHGFKSYSFYDQSPDGKKIKYSLAQGHPVIVWLGPLSGDTFHRLNGNSSSGKGFYVLLIGYDDEKEIFLVCSPKSGETIEMPYMDFPRRQAIEWADTSKLVRKGQIIYPEK